MSPYINNMEANPATITSANWAKAIANRSVNQRSAHLYITFSNAEAANRAIANGLAICNKKCQVEKSKKEPTRCLKCQGWNHITKDCKETDDTCSNCTSQHRSWQCSYMVTKCVSCKSTDHPSWSWQCPTFLKKLTDLNNRNLDNSTLFFPSQDPWTWTTKMANNHSNNYHTHPQKQYMQTNTNPRPRPTHSSSQTTNIFNKPPPFNSRCFNNFPNFSSLHNQAGGTMTNLWSNDQPSRVTDPNTRLRQGPIDKQSTITPITNSNRPSITETIPNV